MIDTDLDIKINALQGRVHETTMEIYRLQEENIKDLKKMRDLVAERDRISGLKTRVIDGEIQMGVSYHGGR
jgi:hypothetical protein